jgi:hypothetical protein
MILSNFQKSILPKIQSGEITNVYSFIKLFTKCEITTNTTGKYLSFYIQNLDYGFYPNSEIITIRKKYFDELNIQFNEFIVLCDMLERIHLLRATQLDFLYEMNPNKFMPIFITNEDNSIDEKQYYNSLNKVLFERYEWEFFASPQLYEFIDRNYLTTSEFYQELEKNDRNKSLRLTKLLVIITILLSLLSSIFSYVTYKTQREVYIVNYKDTTKVLLLPNQFYQKDTTKLDKP